MDRRIRSVVASWAIALASTFVSALIATYVPWARSLVTQQRLQQAGNALAQYGINAWRTPTKDGKVTVEAGPKVIAEAVQRGIDVLPKRVLKAEQGPEGLAAIVFRALRSWRTPAARMSDPHVESRRTGATPR